MGRFSKLDIPECEALFRVGSVTQKNLVNRTLDITISGILHENVPVHYHCDPKWDNHSHPHSYAERDGMMLAFAIGDDVKVLCDDEIKPLYVIGFFGGPRPCGVFCFPTQTIFQANVPSLGSNNADCVSGGEILGMTPNGTTEAKNYSLEIKAVGGTLYINDEVITGGIWTHEDWYDQTGWPSEWKIKYTIGQFPQITVKQAGETDIVLTPFRVEYTYYGDNSSYGTKVFGWESEDVDHVCEGGSPHIQMTQWKLTRSEISHLNHSFWLRYQRGINFLSDNFPSGENNRWEPNPLIRSGAKFPQYGDDICKNFTGGFPMRKNGSVFQQTYSTDRFFQRMYSYYTFASEEWENEYGLCIEDEGILTPTFCDLETNYNNIGNPIRILEFGCHFKIEGSSLGALFLGRGFPMVERDFGLVITGVSEEVL